MKKERWTEFRDSMEASAGRHGARAEKIQQASDILDETGCSYLSGAQKEAYAAKFSGREDAFTQVTEFINDTQHDIGATNRSAVCPVLLKKVEDWIAVCEKDTDAAKRSSLSHSARVVMHVAELEDLKKIAIRIRNLINRQTKEKVA